MLYMCDVTKTQMKRNHTYMFCFNFWFYLYVSCSRHLKPSSRCTKIRDPDWQKKSLGYDNCTTLKGFGDGARPRPREFV